MRLHEKSWPALFIAAPALITPLHSLICVPVFSEAILFSVQFVDEFSQLLRLTATAFFWLYVT